MNVKLWGTVPGACFHPLKNYSFLPPFSTLQSMVSKLCASGTIKKSHSVKDCLVPSRVPSAEPEKINSIKPPSFDAGLKYRAAGHIFPKGHLYLFLMCIKRGKIFDLLINVSLMSKVLF